MILLLCLHLIAAIGAPFAVRRWGRRTFWALAVPPAATAVWALAHTPYADGGAPSHEVLPWVPVLGLDLAFRLDGLSWLMSLVVGGIGALVLIYCAGYFKDTEEGLGRFAGCLVGFAGAMLGLVTSDDLLLLYVFWEVTTVLSYLLIGHAERSRASRAAATQALVVTAFGGLAMLAGIVIIGQRAGTYRLSEIVAAPLPTDDLLVGVAALLLLLGAFTKSALIPFQFWLPGAMAAPTPVSAYLHAAAMVKAGIYLVARLAPAFAALPSWRFSVLVAGGFTMLLGAYRALRQHDLKLLLAFGTVSQLGFLVVLLGTGSRQAALAGLTMLAAHALYKGCLFLVVGAIDHATGTRDLRQLSGIRARMPVLAVAATLAAASMAGLPPFNGFISKEMMLHEAVHAPATGLWASAGMAWLVPVLATLGGLFSAAYSLRLVHDVFFHGPPGELPRPHPHEPPWGMKAPVLLLVGVCIVVGLAPMAVAGPLVRAVAHDVLGTAPPDFHLALWHGLNLPLLLSAVAVFGGAALYAYLQRGRWLHRWQPRPWQAKAVFWWLNDRLFQAAGRATALLESRSLQSYAAWMVGSAVAVAAWALLAPAGPAPGTGDRATLPGTPLALAVWLMVVAAATATVVFQHQRFVAVVMAGAVGLAASLTFLGFSAPDLALTQISVDAVSTVLLLMGLALLPQIGRPESAPWRRWRDGALALAGGGGVAWITWLVLTRDFDSISWYFVENSVPKGGGTNMVNVILVDFRGYDTYGEITVLGIAGVGVLALLDGLRTRRPEADPEGRAWTYAGVPLMLRMVARLVLPLALVVTAYIFWRGHGLPGGGFIAGLITAVALVLQYMAHGQSWAEGVLHAGGGGRYTRWIGTGLGIAGLTGLGALLLGRPFLTSAHGHPVLPVLGEAPLATAALFDLGVYITVVGATMLMLSALGAASREAPAPRRAARGGA